MSPHNFDPLSKLQDEVHGALKLWHKTGSAAGPLEYLYLVQAARQEGESTSRQATNKVLLSALDMLAIEQAQDAHLLRLRFLDQMPMHAVANRLNLAEATANKKQRQAIARLAATLQTLERQARDSRLAGLEKRLNLPVYSQLFGVEAYFKHTLRLLTAPEPPWLISVEGLGGIGKTTLANVLARELGLTDRFKNIAWVSAKQQEFLPHQGLQAVDRPILTTDTLFDTLLEQFEQAPLLLRSPQEKMVALTELLKKSPHLIVIDNLETVADYEILLPILRKLASPSKFLLTSRHSLQAVEDVSSVTLKELSRVDTLALLKYEAKVRQLSALLEATTAQMESIYGVVGGNPLALKLVIGQIWALPLSQVLENLKQAQGKKIEALYTHIYWQAWQMLDSISRQALLVMPLAQDGTLAQLAAVSGLEMSELAEALERLAILSLAEIGGDLEQRRYRIHRLTETFLLTEVVKWQLSL